MRSILCFGWMTFVLTLTLAAQETPRSSPKIVWETDVLDAFVKAIENQRPLVVFFASNPSFRSPEGKNPSNAMREELDRGEVQAFAKDAVFVRCEFDHRTNMIRDEFGRRMYTRLKLDGVPTVCILAPRTDHLHETARIDGFVPAATIVAAFRQYFPLALKSDAEAPVQTQPAPGPAATPPQAFAPATPAEAIHQMSRALQAGDGAEVAKLLNPPYQSLYEDVFSAATRLGRAKRQVLAAMDNQFGPAEDAIPYGDDDVKVRHDLQNVSALILEEAHYPERNLAVVRVRIRFRKGGEKTVELRVGRETDGWKIQPEEWLGFTDVERCRRHAEFLNRLAEEFTALAKKISAGELPTRDTCRNAAQELFADAQQTLEVRAERSSL